MMREISGDHLLAAAVVAAIAFLLGVAVAPADILDGIRHFPAPTPAWATIVTGLAWPIVTVILLLRFGREVGGAVRSIGRRIASDRKVTLPGGTSFERDTLEQVDADRERLLDLIDDSRKAEALNAFIASLGLIPLPSAGNFVSQRLYQPHWAAARRLLEGQ